MCIPALHFDLGIYAWMFDAFIADMQKLDMQLAIQLGTSGTAEEDSVAFAAAAELGNHQQDPTSGAVRKSSGCHPISCE